MKAKKETSKYGRGDSKWFVHDRFGMFIHFGLYSLAARHEWVRHNEKITEENYQKYFDHFEPDLFNPSEWARNAKAAGMKYVVLTTKHHEGFCLWDSKYTDYKVTNTPYGKDLLKEFVAAFRKEGIRIGFYYSLIDWHHPEFTVDKIHPQRDDKAFREKESKRDMKKYTKYMRDQVTELLTEFGKIDVLWFDFSYPGPDGKCHEDWESEKLIKLIRKLQPHVMVDNRLDLPGSGDIITPEQYTPSDIVRDENGNPAVWEGCQTFSGSWGYHRDELTWKSLPVLIQMLINHVCRGGNLLLNVGPTARGEFDYRAVQALEGIGKWMHQNSRSIYGCTYPPEEFKAPADCRYTYNPVTKRLYLHIFAWPFQIIHLPGLEGKIKYAQFLHDASEVKFRDKSVEVHTALAETTKEGFITLRLPVVKPNVEVPVIEFFLE